MCMQFELVYCVLFVHWAMDRTEELWAVRGPCDM